MTRASWVDTVWCLGGARPPVLGCVRAVDGEDLTISVIGPDDSPPNGAEALARTGKRRCARIPVAALLRHWTLLEGVDASAFRGHAPPSGTGRT